MQNGSILLMIYHLILD